MATRPTPHSSADPAPEDPGDQCLATYLPGLIEKVFPGGPGDFQLIPLLGDASDRRYYRLRRATTSHGPASMVLMRLAQPYTEGELPFVNVQRYLSSQGIPVPAIIGNDASHGFVLLEDLGDETLESALRATGREHIASLYHEAVDILLAIQRATNTPLRGDCLAFQLAFDVEKLMWELDFFLTHMLRQLCGGQIRAGDETILRGQFLKIASILARQPRVLTHRDYHSRNLMWHKERLRVIDFQDARLGPCQYDLASLLYDSYVVLPDDLRAALLSHYLERKPALDGQLDHEHFMHIFDYMCLQRNLKALGTFAFQIAVKCNLRYVSAIAPTLGYIQQHLSRHPELAPLTELLEAYLFAPLPAALRDVGKRIPDTSPAR